MDTSSIAGSSMMMQSGQKQQALSTAMVKQASDQQNKMAELLAQNAKNVPQPAKSDSSYNFSVLA